MAEVFSNTELISEALAEANRQHAEGTKETEQKAAAIRQEIPGAQRALERYFAAFEEGSLSPADCQERIGRLRARTEALEADERDLAQNPSHESSERLTGRRLPSGPWTSANCSMAALTSSERRSCGSSSTRSR
ncbi:MAG: hypothetical protein ACRDH8_09510 [Actinomycetota bacterium]